jgi:hypothetical protein
MLSTSFLCPGTSANIADRWGLSASKKSAVASGRPIHPFAKLTRTFSSFGPFAVTSFTMPIPRT